MNPPLSPLTENTLTAPTNTATSSPWLIITLVVLAVLVLTLLYRTFPQHTLRKYCKKPSLFAFTIITIGIFLVIQVSFGTAHWYQNLFVRLGLPFDQVLTGIGLLFGLLWTHKRIKLTEDNMKLTEENNFSVQLKNSFELLGVESEEIRIGGIYILGDLAIKNAPYREWLLRQLCIHVKTGSPNHGKDNKPIGIEIQETLNAITKVTLAHPELSINLSNTNLQGAYLKSCDLRKANLWNTDLRGARLKYANLSNVNLENTDLRDTFLWYADLRGAQFCDGSQLQSDLTGVTLTAAHFLVKDKLALATTYPQVDWSTVEWHTSTAH